MEKKDEYDGDEFFSDLSLTDMVLYDGYSTKDNDKKNNNNIYYYINYVKNLIFWFKFW